MKRATVLLVLTLLILTVTTSIVSAKPGNKMEEVCWLSPDRGEKTAYFMMTGSGIVHRFMDGRHDVYKPTDLFPEPGGGDWEEWTVIPWDGPCSQDTKTEANFDDYLDAGTTYWHRVKDRQR